MSKVDVERNRYPYCLVWTPIPILSWMFPFMGHMGIATSSGIIRDFAGSNLVSEDNMAFDWPTRYLELDSKCSTGLEWDEAVNKASTTYSTKAHNILWDNCHSHCGLALSLMKYDNSTIWPMIRLAIWMFFCGNYSSFYGFIKTWLPFLIFFMIATMLWTYI